MNTRGTELTLDTLSRPGRIPGQTYVTRGRYRHDQKHRSGKRLCHRPPFCKMMCALFPRLPKKPVYGINDWYFAYGNNSGGHDRGDYPDDGETW